MYQNFWAVFECNPLLDISLRQGKEIVLSFAVLKTIIFLKELVPSLAMKQCWGILLSVKSLSLNLWEL